MKQRIAKGGEEKKSGLMWQEIEKWLNDWQDPLAYKNPPGPYVGRLKASLIFTDSFEWANDKSLASGHVSLRQWT
jgi:hypothetical protein